MPRYQGNYRMLLAMKRGIIRANAQGMSFDCCLSKDKWEISIDRDSCLDLMFREHGRLKEMNQGSQGEKCFRTPTPVTSSVPAALHNHIRTYEAFTCR